MIRLTSVVLPAPVGPTIATVWPGSATSDRSSISGLSGVVAEGDVLELDPAARVGRAAAGVDRVGRLLVGVEQLEHPLGRGDPGLQQVGHRRDLGQRLGELPRVLDERLHVAEAHRAGRHPQAADDGDRDVVEVPDEHHRRHDDAGDELRAEAGVVQLLVLARRTPPRPRCWRPKTLTSSWPVNVSSMCAVQLAGVRPLRDELLLRALARSCAVTTHRQRDGDQRDQRQQRRDREHHRRARRRR